jgi:hypothetical protein
VAKIVNSERRQSCIFDGRKPDPSTEKPGSNRVAVG